jgi:hypothetical protein
MLVEKNYLKNFFTKSVIFLKHIFSKISSELNKSCGRKTFGGAAI